MQTINLSLSMPNEFNDLITNRLQSNSTKKNFNPENRSIFPQQISMEVGYALKVQIGFFQKRTFGGIKQDRPILCTQIR